MKPDSNGDVVVARVACSELKFGDGTIRRFMVTYEPATREVCVGHLIAIGQYDGEGIAFDNEALAPPVQIAEMILDMVERLAKAEPN